MRTDTDTKPGSPIIRPRAMLLEVIAPVFCLRTTSKDKRGDVCVLLFLVVGAVCFWLLLVIRLLLLVLLASCVVGLFSGERKYNGQTNSQ